MLWFFRLQNTTCSGLLDFCISRFVLKVNPKSVEKLCRLACEFWIGITTKSKSLAEILADNGVSFQTKDERVVSQSYGCPNMKTILGRALKVRLISGSVSSASVRATKSTRGISAVTSALVGAS